MVIGHNAMALSAYRSYVNNMSMLARSIRRLSSGYRINSAADDPAGLAISEKMRAQIRGLGMASKNCQDAISLLQTAEGGMQTTHDILQRMRELAVQAASDTNENIVDRAALNREFNELILELNDTAAQTRFNERGLLDGSFAGPVSSAYSSASAHKSAWAGDGVPAGVYQLSVSTITDRPASAGSLSSAALVSDPAAATTAGGVVVSWAEGTAVRSDTVNGLWRLALSGGALTATNQTTGEQMSRVLPGVADGGSAAIDFGALGVFTVSAAEGVNIKPEDYSGFSADIQVQNSAAEQTGTVRHVASLGNDQIVLETGMTALYFKNSGISVNLKHAINAEDISAAAPALSEIEGEITVVKTGGSSLVIQTGANEGDTLSFHLPKLDAHALGLAGAGLGNRADASSAIAAVDGALKHLASERAVVGALQNRMEFKISNLDNMAENLQAAESRIRDVDYAREIMEFMRYQLLTQISIAILAQANAMPSAVLQLLTRL